MRHTVVRRTALALTALLLSCAALFAWLVSPRQVEAPSAIPSSLVEPAPATAPTPLPSPSPPAGQSSPSSVSPEPPAGPTPATVEQEPPGEAKSPRPAAQRRGAPPQASPPPDGAALFGTYCGRCHPTGSLKLAQPRRDLEAFLRTHGNASDADDRVILDFLAVPR